MNRLDIGWTGFNLPSSDLNLEIPSQEFEGVKPMDRLKKREKIKDIKILKKRQKMGDKKNLTGI